MARMESSGIGIGRNGLRLHKESKSKIFVKTDVGCIVIVIYECSLSGEYINGLASVSSLVRP